MSADSGSWDRVAAAYATSPIHAAGKDLGWLVEAVDPQPGDVLP